MGKTDRYLERFFDIARPTGKGTFQSGTGTKESELIRLIVKSIQSGNDPYFDRDGLTVSQSKLESIVHLSLQSAFHTDNQIEEFYRQMNRHKEQIETSQEDWHIIFPLNFEYQSDDYQSPDTLPEFDGNPNILGTEIQQISNSEWESKVSKIEELVSKSDKTDISTVNEFYFNPYETSGFSGWFVKQAAYDPYYIMDKLEYKLAVFLGSLEFMHNRWDKGGSLIGGWKGHQAIKRPYYYIAYSNDEVEWRLSSDLTPRQPNRLSYFIDGVTGEMVDYYTDLPELDSSEGLFSYVVNSLRTYHLAMSSATEERAFYEFWRALESATLTISESAGMDEPLKRANSVAPERFMEISEEMIESLRNKRNGLIHQGDIETITSEDVELIKSLVDSCIIFLIDNLEKFNVEELSLLYQYLAKDNDSIEQIESEYREELNQIQKELKAIDRIDDFQ